MWIVVTLLILASLLSIGVATIRRLDQKPRRRLKEEGVAPPTTDLNDEVLKRGVIEWKELQQHLRLQELLSIEGADLAGDRFQVILSLSGKAQADVLYVRFGTSVQRVSAGQSGVVCIKAGDSARITLVGNAIDATILNGVAGSPQEIVGDAGFALALSFVNSLTEGVSFKYAARGSELNHRFIKSWDIPSAQSDEAILARVSSLADVSVLAERVRDIQTASSFTKRYQKASPLEAGICYILGEHGGESLRFQVISEVALLIVPAFDTKTSLPEFLQNLTVKSQMHARILLRNELVTLAAQSQDGQYALLPLDDSNVMLGVSSAENGNVDVVHIEEADDGQNVVTLLMRSTPEFKNVLVWVLPQEG